MSVEASKSDLIREMFVRTADETMSRLDGALSISSMLTFVGLGCTASKNTARQFFLKTGDPRKAIAMISSVYTQT